MAQLSIQDLPIEALTEYIGKTNIIQHNLCVLLCSRYYLQAVANNEPLYKKLSMLDSVDVALFKALSHFVLLNKYSLVNTIYKLLYDNTSKCWTISKHKNYVNRLVKQYNLNCNKFNFNNFPEYKEEVTFLRHKYLAHDEYTNEFRELELGKYSAVIDEIVKIYNEMLFVGEGFFNGKSFSFRPFTMDLIQDLIVDCNVGVAAMLNKVHS